MTYEELLSTPVKFHNRGTVSFAVGRDVTDLLVQHVTPASVTLETGAGLSTLVLLHAGVAKHIAITPAAAEFEVIRDVCATQGISSGPLEAVTAKAHEFLPTASLPPLDLVLIDGAHAFPHPFLDWFYTAKAVKVGGLLILDDVQLVTVAILADFLSMETCWERVTRTPKIAAFRKTAEWVDPGGGWFTQPWVNHNRPVKSIRIDRVKPKGMIEKLATKILPWRVQERLRARYGWPRWL